MRKLLVILLLCLITTSVFGQFQHKPMLGQQINWADTLSKGLVGLWLFNEGSGNIVFDLSGNGNDGALFGNTSWVSGKSGSVLDFPGASGDYVDTSLASNDIANGNFTLSVWFKTDVANAGDDFVAKRLITTRDTASSSQIGFGQNNTTIAVFWDDGAGNLGVGTTTLSTATWYFATLTYDGSTLRIYLNAVEENNFAEANLSVASSDTILMGANNPTQRLWNGLIDHVLIYNRALNASEIAELYREPFGMFVKDDIAMLATAAEPPPPPSGQVITIIMSAIPFLIFPAFIFLKKRKSL